MATAKVYACHKPECSHLPLKTFKKLVAHIKRTQSHDPNFLVTCGMPGCCKTYRLFSSFESHIYRNHSKLLEETEQVNDEDISDQEDSECPDSPDALSSMDESVDSESEFKLKKILYQHINTSTASNTSAFFFIARLVLQPSSFNVCTSLKCLYLHQTYVVFSYIFHIKKQFFSKLSTLLFAHFYTCYVFNFRTL